MLFQNFLNIPTYFAGPAVPRTARPTPGYRSLIGEAGWRRLDPAIRARFDEHRAHRAFYGLMTTVRLTPAGRVLALVARLFGNALCPRAGRDMVTMIDVGGDHGGAGGIWQRRYLMPGGKGFTVRSVKRFDPDHGLLECLGRGFVMELDLVAEADALHFVSRGYAWAAGPFHLPLPRVLWPGRTRVSHRELGGGRFRFTLAIVHPWFGELAFQEGDFFEREDRP